MKNKRYYLTEQHLSEFNRLSVKELICEDLRRVFNVQDNTQILQAVHNYYAKKLKIPAVEVVKTDDIDSFGSFEVVNTKYQEENVRIRIDDFLEWSEGVFSSLSTIIHETKHAHQAYLYEKFKICGQVPHSDFEKLILLFRLFYDKGCECDNFTYYANPEELDAFIFEFKQLNKLINRYVFIRNKELVLFRKEFIFKLLSQLKYNKEGINNPELKKILKNIKRNIYCALNGDFGKFVKNDVSKIIASGFDIKNAFNFMVKELNILHDEVLLDEINSRELGIDLKIQSHGFIDYNSRTISWYKNKNSKYHLFIENQFDFSEYDNLINSI